MARDMGLGRHTITWGLDLAERKQYERCAMFFRGYLAPRRGYYAAEQRRIQRIISNARAARNGT